MDPPKLSQEEAARLFHSTFLLISQQNLAQKQKNFKNPPSPKPIPPFLIPPLDPKITSVQQQPSSPLPRLLLQPLHASESPEKSIGEMSRQWSMSKSSSNSEEPDPERHAYVEWKSKEEDSEHQSPEAMHHFTPPSLNPQGDPSSPNKSSQMQEQDHQGLFVESMIKELKRDMQIKSRGKICKSQEIDSKTGQVIGYNFYCRNDEHCPFASTLTYTGHRNGKNEKLYRLNIQCDTHKKGCIEQQEEVAFMRLTKSIDQLEPNISALLTLSPHLKPKEILSEIGRQVGEQGHRFIYSGLNNKHYHKAAKKYFDNMIYKIKSQMGLL